MKSVKVNIINALGRPSSATIPARVVQSLAFIRGAEVYCYEDLRLFIQNWVNTYELNKGKYHVSITDSESLIMAVMQAIETDYITATHGLKEPRL